MTTHNLKIKVFYDGVEVKENHNDPNVVGFTTNISFMKAGGISDYDKFIKDCLQYNNRRPISFQVYDDSEEELESSVKKITEYDPSIFVKVPIMNTQGEFNTELIAKLHNAGYQINITSVYTKKQIDVLQRCLTSNTSNTSCKTKMIISIFAGKIADTGVNPHDIVKYAVNLFKDCQNIEILWAACRSVYNIFEADTAGCHIITVPESVLKRMNRIGNDLEKMTVDTVKQFRQDGLDGKIGF